jgi:hypothetical protein
LKMFASLWNEELEYVASIKMQRAKKDVWWSVLSMYNSSLLSLIYLCENHSLIGFHGQWTKLGTRDTLKTRWSPCPSGETDVIPAIFQFLLKELSLSLQNDYKLPTKLVKESYSLFSKSRLRLRN